MAPNAFFAILLLTFVSFVASLDVSERSNALLIDSSTTTLPDHAPKPAMAYSHVTEPTGEPAPGVIAYPAILRKVGRHNRGLWASSVRSRPASSRPATCNTPLCKPSKDGDGPAPSANDHSSGLIMVSRPTTTRLTTWTTYVIEPTGTTQTSDLGVSSSDPIGSSPTSGLTNSACPRVWGSIAAELKQQFTGCNNLARNAIRFAFHDAAGYSSTNPPYSPASGGADGSLLLNDDEIARTTQNPMQGFRKFLLLQYNKYKNQGVSAADYVQFAGSLGIRRCSGPVVKTVVGREDDANACPDGTLPAAFGAGSDYDSLIQSWEEKGFSPRELGALMGAHSVSQAFAQQSNGVPTGAPQDTTPTRWDNGYFKQTQAETAPRGVYRFDSDVNLAQANTTCGQAYTEFGNDANAWAAAFSPAMFKLSVLGIPNNKISAFTDCTSLII